MAREKCVLRDVAGARHRYEVVSALATAGSLLCDACGACISVELPEERGPDLFKPSSLSSIAMDVSSAAEACVSDEKDNLLGRIKDKYKTPHNS